MKVFLMKVTNETELCALKFWKMAKEFLIKVSNLQKKLTDEAQKEIRVCIRQYLILLLALEC